MSQKKERKRRKESLERPNGLLDDLPKENGVKNSSEEILDSSPFKKMQDPLIIASRVKHVPVDQQKSVENSSDGKKKKKHKLPQDVPMEERLKQITIIEPSSSLKAPDPSLEKSDLPSTSKPTQSTQSMVVLLTQGLHSGDKTKLDTIFKVTDVSVVVSTIRELPVQLVIPLLREIETRFRVKKDLRPLICWLHNVLSIHMSYLTSIPTVSEELSSLNEWINARVMLMNKFLGLQGKLQLLHDQIERRRNPLVVSSQNAKIVFQEESSSDEESDGEMDLFGGTTSGTSDDQGGEHLDANWWNEDEDGDEEEDEEPMQESDDDLPSTSRAKNKKESSDEDSENDELAGNQSDEEEMDSD